MLKVRVRDFQSIEDAVVEIKGFTVITGTNNAGKSAFFRAIRGAFTNAPGYDFVRHGKPYCTVDLEFEDGRTLTWMKGKGINTYIVNGRKLEKVGVGVPPEVAVFGVDPVRTSSADLWPQIAPQITGVSFLLHESGSVVAEAVADVERVNHLSRALKDCESDKRSARASLKIRRNDAKVLAERMDKFVGLDQAVQKAEELEKRHKNIQRIAKANASLIRLGEQVQRARAEVHALDGLEAAAFKLPLSEQVKRVEGVAKDFRESEVLRVRWKRAQKEVVALGGLEEVDEKLPSTDRIAYLQRLREALGLTARLALRFEDSQKEILRAEEAQKTLGKISLDIQPQVRIHKFKKALENMKRIRKRHLECRESLRDLDQQIGSKETELTALTEHVTKVLGTYDKCPTCGKEINHDCVN